MFRWTNGILDDAPLPQGGDPMANARVDADLIMTAAVVGFCLWNLSQRKLVEFGAESPRGKPESQELRDLRVLVGRLNELMPTEHAGKIVATATPELENSSITANEGGTELKFTDRHIPITERAAAELLEIAKSTDDPVGYQGKGAYTGLVSDPKNHVGNITSTKRFNIPGDYGDRWVMPSYARAWGLLGSGSSVGGGMAEEPMIGTPLVGYVHGMTQAIYRAGAINDAIRDRADKDRAVAYEIAVGPDTTKLASCFGCTLFMYANDFPPSCIHLGRAESWAPMYPLRPGDNGFNEMDKFFVKMNTAWSEYCRQQLVAGANRLAPSPTAQAVPVLASHRNRLPLLLDYLEKHGGKLDAGNLVLDALTVHDKVTNYVGRTLIEGWGLNPATGARPTQRR